MATIKAASGFSTCFDGFVCSHNIWIIWVQRLTTHHKPFEQNLSDLYEVRFERCGVGPWSEAEVLLPERLSAAVGVIDIYVGHRPEAGLDWPGIERGHRTGHGIVVQMSLHGVN